MLAHTTQTRAEPEKVFAGLGEGGEDGLAGERGDEFTELGAGDLEEGRRDGRAVAEARKDGQGGELRG